MSTQSLSDHEIAWLNQFDDDRDKAIDLLNSVRKVGADEFRDEVYRLIDKRVRASSQPVGLYAERSIRKWKGHPNRLFHETRTKVKRAHGLGPLPVHPENRKRPETGSEGIIASLITQYVRGNPGLAYDHPGPAEIREKKIRRFVLVTDFIGSGQQASRYLQSAWRIASVKSWSSGKFLKFEVLAFSATQAGVEEVKKHRSTPKVTIVEACPTVFDFQNYEDSGLIDLCLNYGPKDYESGSIPRLGYSDIGALIAFSHGMPNNAPRLFYKMGRNWTPLFMGRVVSPGSLEREVDRHAQAKEKLEKMRELRLAELADKHDSKPDEVMFSLVLSALKKKPRSALVVSARTGLSLAESEDALRKCRDAGWLGEGNALTGKAFTELKYLQRPQPTPKPLSNATKPYYIPTQLRAPK